MGWRGTVRTIGAIARQVERDAMKRARENSRHLAALEKIEAKDQAASAVRQFEDYIKRLTSIHCTCSPDTDWPSRAVASPPPKPHFTSKNENAARRNLDCYKPTLLARLFNKVEKEKQILEGLVERGKQEDERSFSQESEKYQRDLVDHQDETTFATRVLAHETDALLEALRLFEPLSSIGLLGEHLAIKFPAPNVVAVELNVHGEEVIPKDRVKLLASGRASVKPMPKGEYHRLYQDHVCSAGLRVAREMLAFLPVTEVIVTAVDELLDPSTGLLQRTAILSFRAPRETMARLKFDALDPSDSMRNFLTNMEFNAVNGFRRIEPIDYCGG